MEKITSILNDLIRINHDRVVGYEKALEELWNYTGEMFDPAEYEIESAKNKTGVYKNQGNPNNNFGKIYSVAWHYARLYF